MVTTVWLNLDFPFPRCRILGSPVTLCCPLWALPCSALDFWGGKSIQSLSSRFILVQSPANPEASGYFCLWFRWLGFAHWIFEFESLGSLAAQGRISLAWGSLCSLLYVWGLNLFFPHLLICSFLGGGFCRQESMAGVLEWNTYVQSLALGSWFMS